MWVDGGSRGAHVTAYELAKGPVPPGKKVLHTCDRPACIDERHLWAGTDKDNSDDMIAKGRAYHPPMNGSANGAAKLTEEVIPLIRQASGPQWRIAEKYGVSQMIISKIKRGLLWKHVQ